jgi:hypothetical protein
LFWQLFFGSSAQMGKIVANYYSNMVLQHVKGHHLEFHLHLCVLAYSTGTPFLISFCKGLLPSDRWKHEIVLTQEKIFFFPKSSCYDKTVWLLTNSLPLGHMSVCIATLYLHPPL